MGRRVSVNGCGIGVKNWGKEREAAGGVKMALRLSPAPRRALLYQPSGEHPGRFEVLYLLFTGFESSLGVQTHRGANSGADRLTDLRVAPATMLTASASFASAAVECWRR